MSINIENGFKIIDYNAFMQSLFTLQTQYQGDFAIAKLNELSAAENYVYHHILETHVDLIEDNQPNKFWHLVLDAIDNLEVDNPYFSSLIETVTIKLFPENLGIIFWDSATRYHLYIDDILNLDSVKPYPYWNSVDKPDDVSAEDWITREVAWKHALGIPDLYHKQNTDALSFTLYKEQFDVNTAERLRHKYMQRK